MGTRAAAFTSKIRNLQDYHNRIQHGILPLPSGVDVANTLKYFSQTLLSVLKDVRSIPLETMQSPAKDHFRISLFPSLEYKGLYHAIVDLVDSVPLVQYGSHALGSTILQTMVSLVPFLEHEYMDTLPYIVASAMGQFPNSLHKDIIEILCKHLLPFTIAGDNSESDSQNYSNMSTSAVIMMIFQYTENSEYHCQILESLMSLKRDIVKDLLCVIAHGTAKARKPAVELLFHYWPTLNPTLADRKALSLRHSGWKPFLCQRENCLSPVNNEAVKMCLDHAVAISAGERPPPIYVCQDCSDEIRREHGPDNLIDVLLPMQQVSLTCENKNCKSNEKLAAATCFSNECTSFNGNRPIRYCNQCHNQRHSESKHMVHGRIASPWTMEPETQSYMVEAIVRLLQEAQPLQEKGNKESSERHSRSGLFGTEDGEADSVEERQLLSRYGVWLVVSLCTPTSDTPVETLGRLLSMLFQWFHYTACLPDDQAGNSLERLKSEYIQGWLMDIVRTHFEVIVSCLVPHPADYAQVGGHWDYWPLQINQIREGFKRLLCLVPYDIITHQIWDYIIPFWMEAFRHELPEQELSEMKILLSKVLDPDLSPLGFDLKHMYHFLSIRFDKTAASVQEQALYWLQTLTLLEVPIPLSLLFTMFNEGVASALTPEEGRAQIKSQMSFGPAYAYAARDADKVSPTNAELNLTCFIIMLDILVKQVELQEVQAHKGLEQKEAQEVMGLLAKMVAAPWVGDHSCGEIGEGSSCLFCEVCAIWYQLTLFLIEYFCPAMEVTMADIPTDVVYAKPMYSSPPRHEEYHKTSTLSSQKPTFGKPAPEVVIPMQELHIQEVKVTEEGIGLPHIMTATVQECEPQMDTVAIMPTEQVVTAFARAVTLTEDDVAVAKCTVASATLVDENDQTVNQMKEEKGFWHTSQGKFKFTLEELPQKLQLIHDFLKELTVHKDADVLYHLLSILKFMCLHAEVLNKAAKDHRGFLIWCQENLLITNLWELLQAEFSQISQLCVPLILHCITLPCGTDIFWQVVERDFHNENWRARYCAVERVTMIAHFIDSATVKNSPLLQTALANAFCYLIRCLDDIKSTVAQRALNNLENFKASSLKLLVWCLEAQFDTVIVDRPMIIQSIYQLYSHLSSRRFLTWDFFLNRLDCLFLESQIYLERTGEISYIRDLKNTNVNSEFFQRKLTRAHQALSLTHTSRSLAASFGTKWPYKRAMSAPGGMISRQDKLIDKEKIYNRQSSAPVLKRKSSKLTSGLFSGGPSLQHFPNSFFPDGHLRELVQEEHHFMHILHRAMDTDEHDRDTIHLLIFLLMQFFSRPDQAHPAEEKSITRNQSIVLRHLNIMLGYSPAEKVFLISPYKLRLLPVFNAFISMMPKVLDYNFKMGGLLLPMFLPLLTYCPSPQRQAHEPLSPTYSLWLLSSTARNSWLVAVLVILYKYQYNSSPMSRQVQMLIHIVLNTLEAQCHRCKHLPEPVLSPVPSRSRDLSTASVDLENIHERQTPPSDMTGEFRFALGDSSMESRSFHQKTMGKDGDVLDQVRTPKEVQQWKSRKITDYSCSSEGEEGELEAIPESPKSESSDMERFESTCELQQSMPICAEQAHVRLVKDSIPGDTQLIVTNPSVGIAADSAVVVDGLMQNQLHSFQASYGGSVDTEAHEPMSAAVVIEESSKHMKNLVNQLSLQRDRLEQTSGTTLVEMDGDHLVITTANSSCMSIQSPLHNELPKPKGCHPKFVCSSEVSCSQSYAEKSHTFQRGLSEAKISQPSRSGSQKLERTTSLDTRGTAVQPVATKAQNSLPPVEPTSCQSSPGSDSSKSKPKMHRMGALDTGSIKIKPNRTCSFEVGVVDPTVLCGVEESTQCGNSVDGAKFHRAVQVTSGDLSRTHFLKPGCQDPFSLIRPSPERLLPIGGKPKLDTEHKFSEQRSFNIPAETAVKQPLVKTHSAPLHGISDVDKAVQTSKGFPFCGFEIPAQERLLPVGPMPQRRETPFGSPTRFGKASYACTSKTTLRGVASAPAEATTPVKGHPKVSRVEGPFFAFAKTFSSPVKLESKLQSVHSFGYEEPEKLRTDSAKRSDNSEDIQVIPNIEAPGGIELVMASNLEVKTGEGTDSDAAEHTSLSTTTSSGVSKEVENETRTAPDKDCKELELQREELRSHTPVHQQNSGGSIDLVEKNESIELKDEELIAPADDLKGRVYYRQRKQRKSGSSEFQKSLDIRCGAARRSRKVDLGSSGSMGPTSKRSSTSQSSSARFTEDQVAEHCGDCGALLEEYSDEDLGLCVVVLATFVHREPTLAAPLLPEMLRAVARIAASTAYPWQSESNIYLPGGAVSVARQFLRCVLHQLTPNGIFVQLFQSHCGDIEFYKTISAALADFNDLNQVSPLVLLFENLNEKKHLSHDMVLYVMENVATYLECLPLESNLPPWGTVLPQLESFLRKLILALPVGPCELTPLLQIMICVLKIPVINACKFFITAILSFAAMQCHLLTTISILDPFSKIFSHALQFSPFHYQQLLEICHLCNRNLSRERDKQTFTRAAIFELIQMLKFKSSIPDETVLILIQFVLQDAGGTLVPTVIVDGLMSDVQNMYTTAASECMRQNLNDALEFVADVHALIKVKSNFHGTLSHLNEETLGGQMKAGIAQYLSLEITKGNGRDNRAVGKYLPWLYNPPTTVQQGPKEFIECVAHIRLLSWLLLGALQHSALLHNTASSVCQPVPLEANSHIAEHIQVILAGFAEQSKASVLHMSSLFHAFILCQLWTMYCEHMVTLNPPGSEQNHLCLLTLTDFWTKVTPAILQLVCHSKVLSEMVSLHFVSLMEALMECNSTVLGRLLPMWTPVLYSYHGQLPGHLQVRLQMCLNWQPPSQTREESAIITSTFLKWLQRLQFKMGQIELQSSAATQFYSM